MAGILRIITTGETTKNDNTMKANKYYCKTITEATDRSNLYYIASPTATGIKKEGKQITITNKHGKPLAIFVY